MYNLTKVELEIGKACSKMSSEIGKQVCILRSTAATLLAWAPVNEALLAELMGSSHDMVLNS